MDAIEARFSRDYVQARERFRVATAGMESGHFPVDDDHSIDWAWAGPSDARRVLLYTSGLHGVEGFGGGAAQLEALTLERGEEAILFVHALNPWGWANLRRVNEANVDLNRNFHPPGGWQGVDPAYRALDPLLNPARPRRTGLLLARCGRVGAPSWVRRPEERRGERPVRVREGAVLRWARAATGARAGAALPGGPTS